MGDRFCWLKLYDVLQAAKHARAYAGIVGGGCVGRGRLLIKTRDKPVERVECLEITAQEGHQVLMRNSVSALVPADLLSLEYVG